MELINIFPVWALALLIFALRITDVSMGTLRTLMVVQGRINLSMALGFFEVLIWLVVITAVVQRVNESVWLVLAYCAGFASGNGVGIIIERKLSLGIMAVNMISTKLGKEIAAAIRDKGYTATTFQGEGRDGAVIQIFTICSRKKTGEVIAIAKEIDPKVFYDTAPVREWSNDLKPVVNPTGWRAVLKKK